MLPLECSFVQSFPLIHLFFFHLTLAKGKRGSAERMEREATLPSLQHLEVPCFFLYSIYEWMRVKLFEAVSRCHGQGVMMVLAARSLSDMASRSNLLNVKDVDDQQK